MEPIRISAKSIGELRMPTFCPRCFWIKLHARVLPYQTFPGIFSSIDSYSKKITASYSDRYGILLPWLQALGLTGVPVKAPTYRTFYTDDEASQIHLSGTPDEMLQLDDGSYAILDYKTSKLTSAQDALMPIYEAQLNAYAFIAERQDYHPVQHLYLIYYQPVTEVGDIEVRMVQGGFNMSFLSATKRIDIDPGMIPGLLERVRYYSDLAQPPASRPDCKDCEALNHLLSLLI